MTTCQTKSLFRSSATHRPPLIFRQHKPVRAIAAGLRETTGEHRTLRVPVRFEFRHPTARRVRVAGSFNDWNPSATPLVSLGGGRWLRQLWLPPGQYEYLFVADGIWFFDPRAADYLPNVYGTMNAVIQVVAPAKGSNGKKARPCRKVVLRREGFG